MQEGNNYRDDVYSKPVRAGKRTYFFDVKSTRGNDLFMTITESKRTGSAESGNVNYEKHKIFLYKEDFEKFIEGLQETIDYIRQKQADAPAAPAISAHSDADDEFNSL